jgi:FecR protein
MYSCHRWYPALLLMVLFAMPSAGSNAEPRIGVTASTRPSAEGVVGANSQALSPGSELYANETVRTGNRGQADLVLLDNTNLIVGSTSEVLLDKFVYDRTGSSGSVVLQATRGTLRVVTGSQDHRVYQVNTPYGSLGVSESLANFVKDRPGEVISPPGTSTSLSYGEENDFRGTTNDSGGGTTVEVVVKPKGQKKGLCPNGRPPEYGKPCEVECEAVVRLVKGKSASFTTPKGKRAEIKNANDVLCITPSGDIVHSTSSESILSFEAAQQTGSTSGPTTPTGGGNTTITCMSPSTTVCR